jgi:hypothetical protein
MPSFDCVHVADVLKELVREEIAVDEVRSSRDADEHCDEQGFDPSACCGEQHWLDALPSNRFIQHVSYYQGDNHCGGDLILPPIRVAVVDEFGNHACKHLAVCKGPGSSTVFLGRLHSHGTTPSHPEEERSAGNNAHLSVALQIPESCLLQPLDEREDDDTPPIPRRQFLDGIHEELREAFMEDVRAKISRGEVEVVHAFVHAKECESYKQQFTKKAGRSLPSAPDSTHFWTGKLRKFVVVDQNNEPILYHEDGNKTLADAWTIGRGFYGDEQHRNRFPCCAGKKKTKKMKNNTVVHHHDVRSHINRLTGGMGANASEEQRGCMLGYHKTTMGNNPTRTRPWLLPHDLRIREGGGTVRDLEPYVGWLDHCRENSMPGTADVMHDAARFWQGFGEYIESALPEYCNKLAEISRLYLRFEERKVFEFMKPLSPQHEWLFHVFISLAYNNPYHFDENDIGMTFAFSGKCGPIA